MCPLRIPMLAIHNALNDSNQLKKLTNLSDLLIIHTATSPTHQLLHIQGAPIKNNPLEKMLHFSHDSVDLSQTFRLCM